jgi:Cd2+/Zn2+-exporting ATPase
MQRTLSVRHADQVLPDVLVALQALGFEAQVEDKAWPHRHPRPL